MENFSPGWNFSPVSLGNINNYITYVSARAKFQNGPEVSDWLASTGLEFSVRAEVLHVTGPLAPMLQ